MTALTLRLIVLCCNIFLHSSADSGTHDASVAALGWLQEGKKSGARTERGKLLVSKVSLVLVVELGFILLQR